MYVLHPKKNVVLAFEWCPKNTDVLDMDPPKIPFTLPSTLSSTSSSPPTHSPLFHCRLHLPLHWRPPPLLLYRSPSSSPWPVRRRSVPSLLFISASVEATLFGDATLGRWRSDPSLLCFFHPRRRPPLPSCC
jgi:hypothetical protein